MEMVRGNLRMMIWSPWLLKKTFEVAVVSIVTNRTVIVEFMQTYIGPGLVVVALVREIKKASGFHLEIHDYNALQGNSL